MVERGDAIAEFAPLRMVGQKRFGRAEWTGLFGVVNDDDAARTQQAGAHFQIEPHEFKIVCAVDEDEVDGRCGLQQLREEGHGVVERTGRDRSQRLRPRGHGLRDTAGAIRIDTVDTANAVFPHRARQHLGRAGKIGADLDDILRLDCADEAIQHGPLVGVHQRPWRILVEIRQY